MCWSRCGSSTRGRGETITSMGIGEEIGSVEAGEVTLSGIERLWGASGGELGLAGASAPVSSRGGAWLFGCLLPVRVGCCDGVGWCLGRWRGGGSMG